MKMRSSIVGFLLLIVLTGKSQEISPYLTGTNLWYTNPSTTVWNLTAQCGVQTIRIGGAEYDKNMPGNATILSWVKQIRAIGAEPIVQVSQYKSAEVAAALVKYLNIDKKNEIAPVKFWNIGNEPWLQAGKPSVSTAGALVEKYFKPIAAAMKAVDPTIKIYGPDFCYYIEEGINDLFGGKNNIAGKVPGQDYYYCDGISWHLYPQNTNIDLAVQGLESFRSSIVKCKQKVDAVNAALNRTGDDALTWGIGEFNAKGGPETHTWGNGQMFGGILGLCMKYNAKYATTWSMFESGGNRSSTDFSMIDGDMTPRASYRHMEFVAKYFKGYYVDGTSSSNDFVVYGAKNNDQISIMIMHRGYGNPKDYTLTLDNSTSVGSSNALKVKADTTISYSDIISERTTHVLIFRGDSIIKINYSSSDFDKKIAPQLSTMKKSLALPNAPADFNVSSTAYNTTSLSWNDDSDNEFGYIIEREINGVFKSIAMTSANAINYTDTGLTPETTYRYRIVAYNSLGKSDFSEIDSVTTLETPSPKAYNGPHTIPGKIEAENFDTNGEDLSYHDLTETNEGGKYRTTAVDIEISTDKDGGFNVAYVENGEWLVYLLELVTPGTYDMALRTASNADGTKKIEAFIDNVKVGQVLPTNTGGWQNWETKYIKGVEIKDTAPKLLKLKFTGADYNVNWIAFGTDLSTSLQQVMSQRNFNSYFDNINQHILISFDETIKQAKIQVFNSVGQSFYTTYYDCLTGCEIETAGWPKGIYLITVSNKTECRTQKLRIN